MKLETRILEAALTNGATIAGIANLDALRKSPAHLIYNQLENYSGVGTIQGGDGLPPHRLFDWPTEAQSVLVIGLSHPKHLPALDWWDGRGTPGNRILIDIIKRTRYFIENALHLHTQPLVYHVEKGGAFLKDAAVLAGLGCIGKNNLLVTPAYGPRIRLRALLLDTPLDPTGPTAFDPCAGCKVNCRKVCPEGAMAEKAALFEAIDPSLVLPARDGAYDRNRCNRRMEKDERARDGVGSAETALVRYCRRCEFVCPVGK